MTGTSAFAKGSLQVAAASTVGGYSRSGSHPLHSASKPGVLCVDIRADQDDKVAVGCDVM